MVASRAAARAIGETGWLTTCACGGRLPGRGRISTAVTLGARQARGVQDRNSLTRAEQPMACGVALRRSCRCARWRDPRARQSVAASQGSPDQSGFIAYRCTELLKPDPGPAPAGRPARLPQSPAPEPAAGTGIRPSAGSEARRSDCGPRPAGLRAVLLRRPPASAREPGRLRRPPPRPS
jgi:hypothetical protein